MNQTIGHKRLRRVTPSVNYQAFSTSSSKMTATRRRNATNLNGNRLTSYVMLTPSVIAWGVFRACGIAHHIVAEHRNEGPPQLLNDINFPRDVKCPSHGRIMNPHRCLISGPGLVGLVYPNQYANQPARSYLTGATK